MVNKFLTAQKMTTIESLNIANEYVEEEDVVTDGEGSEDGDSGGDDDEMNDQD